MGASHILLRVRRTFEFPPGLSSRAAGSAFLDLGGRFRLGAMEGASRCAHGDCAVLCLACRFLAARLSAGHLLLQRMDWRSRTRMEIPRRQQPGLGAESARPWSLPATQSY